MQMDLVPGTREMVVRRIGVMSVARMYGAICAAFGLLIGAVFALAALIGAGVASDETTSILGPLFGVGAIVLAPVFYGIMGFVGGAIGAALYNVFAAMVGGVKVELT